MSGSMHEKGRTGAAADTRIPRLSKAINAVYGNAATLITRPSWAENLTLHCESGSFRYRPGDYKAKSIVSASAANDTINVSAHGLQTGDGPFRITAGVTVGGLTPDTVDYWAIKVDNDNLKLATSADNAEKGKAVDLTSGGTGSFIAMPSAAPAAAITNGQGSLRIKADERLVIAAPDSLTVQGAGASDILTYMWS